MCFRLEIRVVHRYVHPGTFTVAAQCSSADINITACKIITIHQPVRAFTLFTCYVGNLSLIASNCKALHGEQLQIQMGVNAGWCQDDGCLILFIMFNFTFTFESQCFRIVVIMCFLKLSLTLSCFVIVTHVGRFQGKLQNPDCRHNAAWILHFTRKRSCERHSGSRHH